MNSNSPSFYVWQNRKHPARKLKMQPVGNKNGPQDLKKPYGPFFITLI